MQDVSAHAAADNLARVATAYAFLIAVNVAAWIWAAYALARHPALWGLAVLAYMFGLRHALDADHIAAIDNVVRKVMQQRKNGSYVGLFFALGHSTVVVLACAAIAAATTPVQHRLITLYNTGAGLGTLVSALFLLFIGVANLLVLRHVWVTFQQVRHGQRMIGEAIPGSVLSVTPLTRLCQPLLRLVSRSWHMYLVGLLFGLGFDTATEVGLLSISAQGSMRGASLASVLVFPALFTAAMSLLDTSDSLLMAGAYHWALLHPLRKLLYNLTITAASVIIAFGIGGVEALTLVALKFDLQGGFWHAVEALNDDLSRLGCLVVATFIAAWVVSIVIYRFKRYDRIAIG